MTADTDGPAKSHSSQAARIRVALGVSDEVAAVEGLSAVDLISLGKNGIKSLDDLADLASDELVEIVGAHALTREVVDEIIMTARSHWFVEANLETEK